MLTTNLFIRYLLTALAVQYRQQGLERSTVKLRDSYDFIVVGGGVAGLVIASRLTENPNITVLVLEAGGSGSQYSKIPLLAESLVSSEFGVLTKFYNSTPSKACNGGPCELLVGNVLGGGSVNNYLLFVRGNKLDFDGWSASGGSGWSYDELLPYFRKFESAERNLGSDLYRGRDGPVHVQENSGNKSAFSDIASKWVEAARLLNYNTIDDFNGPIQMNQFAPVQTDIGAGLRVSADDAYIRPVLEKRPNLHVLMFAHVEKILFLGTSALGVAYSRFNETFELTANKEVIVSAGALSTPKLLMVSGLGPAAQLEQFNITVIADLPGVGANLQDHPANGLVYSFNYTFPNDVSPSEDNYCQWRSKRKGIFASTQTIAVGFIGTSLSNSSEDTQAMMFLYIDHGETGFDSLRVATAITRPKSQGSVRLNGFDAFEDPIIDINYFFDPVDSQNMYEALKVAQKLMNTQPFKDIQATLVGPIISKCPFTLGSDDHLKCIADKNVFSMSHYSGTCKMGKTTDPMAVVDNRLRVFGNVQNIRVIDTSVMPTITRGNTMAPAYAIAEKGADMIKQDWKI